MAADPKRHRDTLAQAAAIANGNQRLTRALTTIALHLTPGAPLNRPEVGQFSQLASDALDALAVAVTEDGASALLAPLLAQLEDFQAPLADPGSATAERDRWVFGQMSRAALELSAMLLAASRSAE
jgi:hypothetical protein